MKKLKIVKPEDSENVLRLDRISPALVEWFIQSRHSEAATLLAQQSMIQAQIDDAPMAAKNGPGAQQAAQQGKVLQQQALVNLSVAQLCREVSEGPYFTRQVLDDAIVRVQVQIAETAKTDEEERLMKSGLWKLCKEIGIPMGGAK